MKAQRFAAAVALLLLASCGGDKPDANAAMLEELRALRQAVAPQPVDSRTLAQAIEPLTESVRALRSDQAAAQQRQQSMSDELSRWTMFLALTGRTAAGAPMPPAWPQPAPVGAATAAPGTGAPATATPQSPAGTDQALLARIAELERQLAAHETHQRDVETIVERSLDGTAAHVDRILEQLQSLAASSALTPRIAEPAVLPTGRETGASRPTEADAPRPTEPATPDRTRTDGNDPAEAAAPPADNVDPAPAKPELIAAAEQRESSFLRNRTQLHQLWLVVVLTLGLGAIGLLAWRLLQRPSAPPREEVGEPKGDMTTDELWAAAGLLSEAVGRLRSAVPTAAPVDAMPTAAEPTQDASAAEVIEPAGASANEPPAAAPIEAASIDDVFVLDDERNLLADIDWNQVGGGSAAAAPAEPPPAPPPANGHAETGPPRWAFQLEAQDHVLARATIDAYLQHDPRVLRAPAPIVRPNQDGLEVHVALLPGLLPGEREHLRSTLQRLLRQG